MKFFEASQLTSKLFFKFFERFVLNHYRKREPVKNLRTFKYEIFFKIIGVAVTAINNTHKFGEFFHRARAKKLGIFFSQHFGSSGVFEFVGIAEHLENGEKFFREISFRIIHIKKTNQ
ncbi:hypothetical protein KAI54_02010 [Candidatus Gracilibacteria bacterium]|nr:hypothetical protein [Candidatus Gracilibacteria bacterium]